MYTNRKLVRDIPVKVRFNELEWEAIVALANLAGMQVATFIHEKVLMQLDSESNDTKKVG